MKNKKQLVIFDLDGTLLNTIRDLGLSCNYALEKLGYQTRPLATYPFLVGNGVRKLIQRAQPDLDDANVDKVLEVFKEHYDEHCTDNTVPYPGVPEMLRKLRTEGIDIAVASNKYQRATDKIIKALFPDIDFCAVMGQTDFRPVKPDPSIVFAVLNERPTPKADVLYCGDSAVDMETARRACVESVGVTWGFRPVSELRQAYADHIVSTTDEILRVALASKETISPL